MDNDELSVSGSNLVSCTLRWEENVRLSSYLYVLKPTVPFRMHSECIHNSAQSPNQCLVSLYQGLVLLREKSQHIILNNSFNPGPM